MQASRQAVGMPVLASHPPGVHMPLPRLPSHSLKRASPFIHAHCLVSYSVAAGEKYVRLNVRNNSFSTVMAAIGSVKPPAKVVLEFQRCQ